MYPRVDGSNFGHFGNSPLFGLPVFAKLVQYCCIVSESFASTSVPRTRGPNPNTPTAAIVPNTCASSDACVAPTLSRPGGTRANSNSKAGFPAEACHLSCWTALHLNLVSFPH